MIDAEKIKIPDEAYLLSLNDNDLRFEIAGIMNAGRYAQSALFLELENNIPLFSRIFFPHKIKFLYGIPDFHKEFYEFVQKGIVDPEYKKMCYVIPRDHAKTTTLEVFLLHCICYKKHPYVIFWTETKDLASGSLNAVKSELINNELLIKFYGDLSPKFARLGKGKWASHDIEIDNGTIKLSARSFRGRVRGAKWNSIRPSLIVIDDPESMNNTSVNMMKKNMSLYARDIAPAVESNTGQTIAIGNIVANGCMLDQFSKAAMKKGSTWKAIRHKIIEDGKPLWPKYWPISKIELKKKELTELDQYDAFLAEYMNEPLNPADRRFSESDIQYYDGRYVRVNDSNYLAIESINDEPLNEVRMVPINIYMATDLASSEKSTADYNVHNVMGRDQKGNLYEIDIWRERTSDVFRVAREFIKRVIAYHPKMCIIETVVYQSTFIRVIQEERKNNDYNVQFPIHEIAKREASKNERIAGAQPKVSAHKFYLRQGVVDKPIKEEMINWQPGRAMHDDILDTIADIVRHSYDVFIPPKDNSSIYDHHVRMMKEMPESMRATFGVSNETWKTM